MIYILFNFFEKYFLCYEEASTLHNGLHFKRKTLDEHDTRQNNLLTKFYCAAQRNTITHRSIKLNRIDDKDYHLISKEVSQIETYKYWKSSNSLGEWFVIY